MTIKLRQQPPVPGTIIDGSTGTVIRTGQIVGDYIKLAPNLYFATDDNGKEYSGTAEEIKAQFSAD